MAASESPSEVHSSSNSESLAPASVHQAKSSLATKNSERRFSFGPLGEQFAAEIASIDAEWNPLPWGSELFKSELRNPVSAGYGIFSGRDLVGYLFAHVVIDGAHIVSFGIHRLWRRRGAGEKLLRYGISRMVKQGVRFATLEVRAANHPARALYEKLGFVPVGIRRKYYSDNGEDAVTMRCECLL